MASQWLNQTLAQILTVVNGNASETATQNAVTTLTARLATDEGNATASNAEFQQAITALVTQLAAVTPPAGPLPVVSSIAPTTGALAGNQPYTITGTGFTGATVVNFGAVAGTNLVVVSDTSITVNSPAQTLAGPYDITVVTPKGISAVVAADVVTLA